MTDFHFLFLYADRIVGVNTLNHAVTYQEPIPLEHGETVLGFSTDSQKRTYWVHTNLCLYEVIVDEEDRDVCQLLVEKRSFEEALLYAKVNCFSQPL